MKKGEVSSLLNLKIKNDKKNNSNYNKVFKNNETDDNSIDIFSKGFKSINKQPTLNEQYSPQRKLKQF